VMGADYFGESKKGVLRMLNEYVYQQGGLVLHAGAKAVTRTDKKRVTMTVMGLSGTGKTTTTFREVLGSLPVQDDFIGLMPGGRVHATEDGCFAKTYGLDPDDEPTIYGGTTRPDAWLENTHVEPDGRVDFFDDTDTRNGRSTFPLANIRHRDPMGVPPASYILLLNRNETIIPAVAKLRRDQIGAYFMLGETKGTSAGGSAEAGKSLRVPGTNPFFFTNDALQGNRLLELLETMPDLEVYLMSTGRVGGGPDVPHSKKVQIAHSSAVVQGIVEGTITWKEDPDFGYSIAAELPGFDDPELLQPRTLYEREGRAHEYDEMVSRLTEERREYLRSFPGLDPSIVESL
jgi:phosphoenolpyruvate carboxykinase (ATP)